MNSIFIKIGDTGVVLSKRCNETAFVWIDRCGERYVKRMVGLDTNKIVAVVAKLNLPKNLVVGNTNNENGICHIESDIEFADGEACFQEVYKNGEWIRMEKDWRDE